MKQDPVTTPKPWLSIDASEQDLAACGHRFVCWSHLGNQGDLYIVKDITDVSTELAEFRQPPAQDRLHGQEFIIPRAKDALVHLVHALGKGIPVAIAAPIAEFGFDGSMATLLIVVETLLPRQWSETLYIRGFTRNPRLFLNDLHCNLIAVPADAAESVLEARRDAILLDQQGRPAERQDPSPAACGFADAVCELAVRSPELLEPVLDRLGRVAPNPADLPSDIAGIFELALLLCEGNRPGESHLDDVLRKHTEIVAAEDCHLLSESSLRLLALSQFDELRGAAVREIERRASENSWNVEGGWDESLMESPRRAIDAILSTGQWQEWRHRSQLSPSLLREAAICWCSGSHWRLHEPLLEDWVQVLRDLGTQLEKSDLTRMTDHEVRPLPFPPITWFETQQRSDLERLVGNRTFAESQVNVEKPASRSRQPAVMEAERHPDNVIPVRKKSDSDWDGPAPPSDPFASQPDVAITLFGGLPAFSRGDWISKTIRLNVQKTGSAFEFRVHPVSKGGNESHEYLLIGASGNPVWKPFSAGKQVVQPTESVVVPVDRRARDILDGLLRKPAQSRVLTNTKVGLWIALAAIVGFLLAFIWKR